MKKNLFLSLAIYMVYFFPVMANEGFKPSLTTELISEFEIVEQYGENSVLQYIGRIHPVFVHFPIAWLVLLILCDLLRNLTRNNAFRMISPFLLVITLVSFLPAFATGLANLEFNREYVDELRLIILHRNIMFVTFILLLAAAVLRIWRRAMCDPGWAYSILTWVAGMALIYAAELGGKIAHGVRFFPFLETPSM